MGNFFQQGPSISELETKFFQAVGNLPPDKQNYANIVGIAAEQKLPNPPKAAEYWLKQYDAHRKRIKEDLPGQPTGTTPLDVPLARKVKDVAGLDYLQAAPIQSPLGMQGDLPMTIQDLISSLPSDYQLPSPIQGQQPELSVFGPQALGELPQQTTQPYIASDIIEKVMAASTRPAGISCWPWGSMRTPRPRAARLSSSAPETPRVTSISGRRSRDRARMRSARRRTARPYGSSRSTP